MGTFAFSSHIQSKDHQAVAAAITALLGEQGYTPVKKPQEKKKRGRSERRGIWLTASHNGWVSWLDSNLCLMHGLTAGLSSRLDVWGLIAHVNDSDSWGYTLFHDGAEVDIFDSLGEQADETPALDSPMLQGQQNIEENWRTAEEAMAAAMPPDIRAIQRKRDSGAANSAEINCLIEWTMTSMRQVLDEAGVPFPGIKGGLGKRDPEEVSRHAKFLAPLLPDGVTSETLVDVMCRQAVFADEVLSGFFRTLGIHADFAHWTYDRFSQERGEDTDVALPVVLHLSFEGSGPGNEPPVLSYAEKRVQGFVDEGDLPAAWMEAARRGIINYLRARLTVGDDVNARSEDGKTALMITAFKGKAEAMQVLIAAGADLNAVDIKGNTALMWAIMGSGILQPLLDAGADLHIRRADGKTALAIAMQSRRQKTVELLRQAGALE